MSNLKAFESLNTTVEQEKQRHIANILKLMAKAKALRIRGKITSEEYNQLSEKLNYNKIVNQEFEEYIENLMIYRVGLTSIYSRAIDAYSKYQTGTTLLDSIPDYIPEMEEFFKYLGCYGLYKRIKDRCMIINDPNATLNVCINGGKTSYIVLKKPYINKEKPKSATIVHEMGHAYFYNVTANSNTSLFARDINSEIVSVFFERLYLDYLLKTAKDPDLIRIFIKNFETRFLKLTQKAKEALEAVDNPSSEYSINGAKISYKVGEKQVNTDAYTQTYAIGNIGSAKLLRGYGQDPENFIKYLPEIISSINDMNFEIALLEHTDIEPLEECLENNLILKLQRKDT